MNRFTIKDIENLSGIKAHTWRMWEQRYGLGIPQRKESNQRFYDNENLKQVLRISYLYHSGMKISKIALLGTEQIRMKALDVLSLQDANEYFVKELLEASVDLDEERFDSTLQDAVKRFGIEKTMLKIIHPLQDKIGVLWLTDHVIPAQEHFTSNIISKKLSVAVDSLAIVRDAHTKTIVLFTPEHELHELPLQFIHYLLRKQGHNVIYFGRNVSLQSIKIYEESKHFDYMHFHYVTNVGNRHAQEYVNSVSLAFPGKKIIMSGMLVQQVSVVPENVRLLNSMEEIIRFVEEF